MLRKFTQLMSIGLIFSLFLFLMVACSDDDDVASIDNSSQQEEPAPPSDDGTDDDADEGIDDDADDGTDDDAADDGTDDDAADDGINDRSDQVASIDNTCILWKPISEGDRRLVVLLPANYGTPELFIQDKDGNILDKGRYTGRTNGNRPTYRFSKSGGQYPNPCYLEVGGELFKVNNPRLRHSC